METSNSRTDRLLTIRGDDEELDHLEAAIRRARTQKNYGAHVMFEDPLGKRFLVKIECRED